MVYIYSTYPVLVACSNPTSKGQKKIEYSSQDKEATKVSINRKMEKEDVMYEDRYYTI